MVDTMWTFSPTGINRQRLPGPHPERHSYFNASKPLAVLDLATGSHASWNWRTPSSSAPAEEPEPWDMGWGERWGWNDRQKCRPTDHPNNEIRARSIDRLSGLSSKRRRNSTETRFH